MTADRVNYDGMLAPEEPNVLDDERRELSEAVARLHGWSEPRRDDTYSEAWPAFDSPEMIVATLRDCEGRRWPYSFWPQHDGSAWVHLNGVTEQAPTYAEALQRAYVAAREASK